jgi:putative membrane protein
MMRGRAIRAVGAAFSGLLYAAIPVMAHADQSQDFHYGPHMWSGGWHGWFIGPIMMILFIAVAAIVVVLVVRWLGGPGHASHSPPGRTPLDILKERFARGEIDKAEFEERRQMLAD